MKYRKIQINLSTLAFLELTLTGVTTAVAQTEGTDIYLLLRGATIF